MRNKELKRRHCQQQGFMLLELVITIAILIIVLIGYLQLFIYCLGLAETSGNISLAVAEAQDKLEEMRSKDLSTIFATYSTSPETPFSLSPLTGSQLTGIRHIYFPNGNTYPQPIEVEIVISWVDSKGRNIGYIDQDSDNRIDSPVELRSIIGGL